MGFPSQEQRMADLHLSLSVLKDTYAVCRLAPDAPFPDWANYGQFFSITRTPTELSIVCPQHLVGEHITCEKEWRCLQIAGPLNFTLVGILSALLAPLAEAGISIFAVSTFETDYVFVKTRDLEMAIATLSRAGHWINRSDKQEL
jgi:hypothetical protein